MSQKFPWASPWAVLPVAAAVVFYAPKPAAAATFGVVSDYNVFVLGDMNQKYTDVEGRIAVGGNATFQDFSTASKLQETKGLSSLVVGGNLSYTRGKVFLGDAVYGGTANLSQVSGTFNQAQGVLDFAKLGQELKDYSSDLAKIASNTQTEYKWGGIYLQGNNSNLNVFTVDGSQFGNSTYLRFSGISESSTVLINVLGNAIDIKNFGFDLPNGVSRQKIAPKILFNFVDATQISTTGFGFDGSVLAPKAHFNFDNGQINGNLIVGSLSGTGESHNIKFDGDLPPMLPPTTPGGPAKVPEPTTVLGLASLGAALRLSRRQNKRQQAE